MPGIQEFTYLNYGKETTRGTPVAPTRKWIGDATGVLGEDLALNFHETESRGRRAIAYRVTQQHEDASLKISGEPTFDDLVFPHTSIKGGVTGTGAGADKSWAFGPNMTGANNQEAFSVDAGDDVQNWRFQYVQFSRFSLASSIGKVTKFEGDAYAQRALKVAKANPSDPAVSPKLVADHWTVKFAGTFAGLPGAAVQINSLLDSKIELMTGLKWRHYQDGNLYGSQHVETAYDGKFSMTVESTAFAVSEFYDKWKAQTLDYVRYKNTSPVVLGGSFPSLQYDFAVFWSNVQPIGDQTEGINVYKIEGRLVDDGTNPLVTPTLVCSLAAIP